MEHFLDSSNGGGREDRENWRISECVAMLFVATRRPDEFDRAHERIGLLPQHHGRMPLGRLPGVSRRRNARRDARGQMHTPGLLPEPILQVLRCRYHRPLVLNEQQIHLEAITRILDPFQQPPLRSRPMFCRPPAWSLATLCSSRPRLGGRP
jgi:hypothetical protein